MKKLTTLIGCLFLLQATAQIEGKWKLSPTSGALAVGLNQGDGGTWWANSSADVTTRACLFDDSLEFLADGTFAHYMDGSTWLETWQGVASESCGTPVSPHDGTTNAPYTYSYNSAAGELTVNGVGAHIGLPKVINGGEINNPANAVSTITYKITFSPDNNTMMADIALATGWWRFTYERIVHTSTSPLVGTWQLKPEAGSLGVGGAQGDNSWWSVSSAEVSLRACLFDDSLKFDADGTLTHYMDGSTWLEGWQGANPAGCGTPVAPHDGITNAPYSYIYNESAGELTVNGIGAHLGLPKVINGGEINDPANAVSTITYKISFTPDNNTMIADIAIANGWWRFVYQRTDAVVIPDPNVTFRVNMSNYTGTIANGVYVNGSFNGWCGTCNPLTNMGNGIWQATLPIPAGPIEYLYTVDGFTDMETFSGSESCLDPVADQYNNRYINVTGDVVLPLVCFESCDACLGDLSLFVGTWKLKPDAGSLAVGPTVGSGSWWANSLGDVTTRACLFDDSIHFDANGSMTHYMGNSTWLEAWQGMSPDGCGTPVSPHNGVGPFTFNYSGGELTINGVGGHIGLPKAINGSELTNPSAAPKSVTYQITFANNNNTMIADIAFATGWWRFIYDRVEPIVTLDPMVTFSVDMSTYTATIADAVYLNGSFNSWCGSCTPMTDMGSGIWSVTLPIPAGPIEYLYTVDVWSDMEQFNGTESCVDTVQDGFNNRYYNVVTDVVIPQVCFESCSACTNGLGTIESNTMTIYPNPSKGMITIKCSQEMEMVDLLDLSGRVIMHLDAAGTSQIVDLSSLETGGYFVRIKSSNGIYLQKIAKQ